MGIYFYKNRCPFFLLYKFSVTFIVQMLGGQVTNLPSQHLC